MKPEITNWTDISVLVTAVVLFMIVASIGFASLSENPLVPESTFEASDAPDEYDLEQRENVDLLTVDHVRGESVSASELEFLLGTRATGLRYNSSNNWKSDIRGLTWQLRMNGHEITRTAEVSPGDSLTITKVNGTTTSRDQVEIRVRVYHTVTDTKLLDQRVTVT